MSFSEKLKSRIITVKEELSKNIELVKVDEEVRNSRLSICTNCEHLFKPTNSCKKCGCFMNAKTWLKSATCPINKW